MVNRGRAGLGTIVRLVALGVIAAAAGCSDEACFMWTQAEGQCPAQEEALQFFSTPGCSGSVESVDSDGEFVVDEEDPFPGELCCYTVTRSDNDADRFCSGAPPF